MIADGLATLNERGPGRVSPFLLPHMIPDAASGMVAIQYGIRGPNLAVVSACATGGHAIGEALETIVRGQADLMLGAGTEAVIVPIAFAGFGQMRALGSPIDPDTGAYDPTIASRPFDATRNGFVVSEGCAVLVLEELEHARARGARIYGELVGYGATSDGHDMVQPSGEGAARCMRQALATVRERVDYINPHATSTPAGDPPEIEAIRKVFGVGEKCPPIAATKALTGHSLGATGVQEAIYSLLMMNNGFVCESANITELDPVFADMPIVRKRIDNAKLGTVLSNSFGFGGTNATLVFKRMDA
jgi:3-oxoacyl-[acyl-carrier-protein] synthase-1